MEDEKFEEMLEDLLEHLGVEAVELEEDHVVDGTLTDAPASYWDTVH